MNKKFEGKTVFITGASSGIGAATARAFSDGGARVFGVGSRPETVRAASMALPEATWFAADLRDMHQVEQMMGRLRAVSDRVDVLVNAAGAFAPGPLETMSSEDAAALFAINVVALSAVTRACLPLLRAVRGTIVNVSSAVGHKAAPQLSHYAATKAAVESLTRSWALELAPEGVRVNAIAPGPTATGALERAGLPPDVVEALKAKLARAVPLARMATAEEVAHWIVAIADPGVSWMTGHVLSIDGGMSLT